MSRRRVIAPSDLALWYIAPSIGRILLGRRPPGHSPAPSRV
jgi:hypothetical protein